MTERVSNEEALAIGSMSSPQIRELLSYVVANLALDLLDARDRIAELERERPEMSHALLYVSPHVRDQISKARAIVADEDPAAEEKK